MQTTSPITSDDILQSALKIASTKHWEEVRLVDVAQRLEISLAELRLFIRDKEDLVDLLWDQADATMLKQCSGSDFTAAAFTGQFEQCVMCWLRALQPYRRTVKEMLQVRLEPGHLHIQIPTLIRISQTVQWMRELCQRDAVFIKRAVEESVLTCLFLNHFRLWLNDESENSRKTRQSLQRHIGRATQLEKFWPNTIQK